MDRAREGEDVMMHDAAGDETVTIKRWICCHGVLLVVYVRIKGPEILFSSIWDKHLLGLKDELILI